MRQVTQPRALSRPVTSKSPSTATSISSGRGKRLPKGNTPGHRLRRSKGPNNQGTPKAVLWDRAGVGDTECSLCTLHVALCTLQTAQHASHTGTLHTAHCTTCTHCSVLFCASFVSDTRFGYGETCALRYCNSHTSLKTRFCGGQTCTSSAQAAQCLRHWHDSGESEGLKPDPTASCPSGVC